MPGTSEILDTYSADLVTDLSEEECQSRAAEAALISEKRIQLGHQVDELRERAKALKGESETMGGQVARLLDAVRTRKETRRVICRDELDGDVGMVFTIRTDTGEVIGQRLPTQEEAQGRLFMIDGEPVDRGDPQAAANPDLPTNRPDHRR